MECNLKTGILVLPGPHREKYIFLVRHATSTWNEAVASGAGCMVSNAWDTDHPLSPLGVKQTHDFRNRIDGDLSAWGGAGWNSTGPDAERVRQYYNLFLARRDLIYCSPLLRALQTAHLAFPSEDGWGTIRLLKDAREHYRFVTERDCLGAAIGKDIVGRAVRMGNQLQGLDRRVDYNDCFEEWWSRKPETGTEFEARHRSLWETLFRDDASDSCIVVTHSNLIRALLARFGSAEESVVDSDRANWRRGTVEKLENCGVLGLRCVFGGVETLSDGCGQRQNMWVVQDAHLMFGSKFEANH